MLKQCFLPSGWVTAVLGLLLLNSCSTLPPRATGPVRVVATLAPLADWMRTVGGNRVSVTQLVPAGRDPRSYSLTAANVNQLNRADVIVFNGQGLEPWLESQLDRKSFRQAIIVDISQWVEPLADPLLSQHAPASLNPELTDEQLAQLRQGDPLLAEPLAPSPYQWLDPPTARNVVNLIAQTLIRVDPNGLLLYRQNAAAYNAEIENLEHWMQRMIDQLPQKQFNDLHGFLEPFRTTFKWSKQPKSIAMTTRAAPPILVDAYNLTPQAQHALELQKGKGRIDPLNNEQYLVLMRTVTQQFLQSFQP